MPVASPSLLIPMAADIGGLEIARLQARQFLENNAVDGRVDGRYWPADTTVNNTVATE